ncbi:hypothetical protein [Roseimaritima sediminicola]|uniref:hypothetical protein n=1 Tax=Roseimaritima sediminicola TaxID=2662066 RepID=UPI0013872AFE|nr:hypothetical protein [Roseimaritima sediminicola]
MMTVDREQAPKSCIVADWVMGFDGSVPEPVPIAFSFKVLDNLVATIYQARKGRPEERSDFSLPLPRMLKSIKRTDLQANESYMQELVVCESGAIFLSYRMPAEAKFFGYPIRACFTVSKGGPRQWFTNFNGAGVEHARVQHPGALHDPGQEQAKKLTRETCRQLFLDKQYQPWANIYSDLLYRMVASSSEASAKTLSPEGAHDRERLFYQLMRRIRREVDSHLNDGTSLFLDPFVRGMMLEQSLWQPQRHPATVTHLLSRVLNDLESSSGQLSLSYSLICAYADLGFAPNETSHAVFTQSLQDQTSKDRDAAAVLARWRWPTEQRHVDATVEFLKHAKHPTDRMNCVETLILMDRISLVPADLLRRWFEGIEGEADQIRRPLNLLMQNAAGRRYLADKFLAMPADAALREPIRALFANELTHVRKSGDYRFWTREECDGLESDLQLELTGNEKR